MSTSRYKEGAAAERDMGVVMVIGGRKCRLRRGKHAYSVWLLSRDSTGALPVPGANASKTKTIEAAERFFQRLDKNSLA